MSRSRKDILETEAMLTRLTNLLVEHASPENKIIGPRADAEALRRISMTLHRWHELECGDSNQWNSFCLVRGKLIKTRVMTEQGLNVRKDTLEHDDNGLPYLEIHHNSGGTSYVRQSDHETSARKRLAKILKNYPGLRAYVQTDPRGCALYILRTTDIPASADVSSCYNRGLAVHR